VLVGVDVGLGGDWGEGFVEGGGRHAAVAERRVHSLLVVFYG